MALRYALVALFVLFAQPLNAASVTAPIVADGRTLIDGYVRLDVVKVKSTAVKLLLNGGDQIVFVRSNGYFSFELPAGSFLLQVEAPGALFAPVRLEVSLKHAGSYRAASIREFGPTQLSIDPLILSPLGVEEYFEKREPFSVWSLLRSPMGMMVAFMVVCLFILPKLMDSIDPEEMKQLQEEMRTQQVPSLSSLLSGATASSQ